MPLASSPHLSVNCQIADQLVPSAARAFWVGLYEIAATLHQVVQWVLLASAQDWPLRKGCCYMPACVVGTAGITTGLGSEKWLLFYTKL